MLEYWYKEKRTLIDFRRGPLGEYFDDFAAYLKAKGYSHSSARGIFGRCCQFNIYLIERGISRSTGLSESLIDSFLEVQQANVLATGSRYIANTNMRPALKHLFAYLIDVKAFTPPQPKRIVKPYTWLLEPYLRHLHVELELSEKTVKYHQLQLSLFLDAVGKKAERNRLKTLTAEMVETFVRGHFRNSTTNLGSLSGVLRSLFRYCASHHYTRTDFQV